MVYCIKLLKLYLSHLERNTFLILKESRGLQDPFDVKKKSLKLITHVQICDNTI